MFVQSIPRPQRTQKGRIRGDAPKERPAERADETDLLREIPSVERLGVPGENTPFFGVLMFPRRNETALFARAA